MADIIESTDDYTITLELGVTASSIHEAIQHFLDDANDSNLVLTFTVTHDGQTTEIEYDHDAKYCSEEGCDETLDGDDDDEEYCATHADKNAPCCEREDEDAPHEADCPVALAQDLEDGTIGPNDDSYSDALAAYEEQHGKPFSAPDSRNELDAKGAI